MCCLKIDTETLLANCLNTCKTYSFSPDDLQQIVRLMANATDRYIFSGNGDDTRATKLVLEKKEYAALYSFADSKSPKSIRARWSRIIWMNT